MEFEVRAGSGKPYIIKNPRGGHVTRASAAAPQLVAASAFAGIATEHCYIKLLQTSRFLCAALSRADRRGLSDPDRLRLDNSLRNQGAAEGHPSQLGREPVFQEAPAGSRRGRGIMLHLVRRLSDARDHLSPTQRC